KDYVGGQMFRSFFGYTFCYLLFLLMWVLYKLDELLNEMSIDEILDAAKKWGVIYAAGLVLYLIVTWIVYSKRYDYAARSQTMYTSKLKHLVRRYEKEGPERKRDNRGGRAR
uniref:hypothetical protein n=1 Tax=Enterocloster citroniae TaxID=358743 RepID=UPI00349E7B18